MVGFIGSGILDVVDLKPGHLFWMQAGSTWLNRDKPRPFALVTPCSPSQLSTLAYGSTQQTEMRHGAAHVAVSPVRSGLHRNRLSATTYFYPGTLVPIRHTLLPQPAGFIGKFLPQMREMLRLALGIGQGSCLKPGSPSGSRRGRVVVLRRPWAQDIRTYHAVLLTEPRYSVETNYQIILPIYPTAGKPAGEYDLLISSREWLDVFPATTETVLLAIPATHSVWHDHGIARETEYVVDEESLAQIDRHLCAYFSLPMPAPEG